jgi:hypothetical protein
MSATSKDLTNTICSTWIAAKQIMVCAKWIKQHTPPPCIGDLLTHPRNDEITHTIYSSSRAVFQRTDGDIYKGITKELEAMFWEDKRLPPGMPDANRSLQMLRMETEVKNRKLEVERDKRARIRALENKKKKARELYSGGGMGSGEGSDEKLFSGGMGDSGNQMNISGAMGGDLSGNSGDMREIRLDNDNDDSCADDMDMSKIRQELKLIDMTRVCYHRGVGPKHGSKVHADMELISEMIRAESNRLGHMGEDPPTVRDTHNGNCGWGDAIWDDVPPSSAYTRGGISQYERGRLLCLSGIIKFLDPCAFAIFNRLVSDKIVPLQTEFPVYDEYIKMATNIDMIAWDIGNSKGIFIELKTGHNAQTDYNAHDSISFFKTDHKTLCIQDTALNRACFQLLTSLLFVAQRYSIQFDAALIVRTASASIQPNDYHGDQINTNNNKTNRKTRAAAAVAHKSTRLVQLYRIPSWMIEQSCQVMLSESLRNRGISHINKMKKMPADAKKILIDEIKNAPNNVNTWLPNQISSRGYALWYHSITTGGGGGGGGIRSVSPQPSLFSPSPSPYNPYKEKYIYKESEIIEREVIIIKDQDYNQSRISDRRDKNPFFNPSLIIPVSSSLCPNFPPAPCPPLRKHVPLSPKLRVKKTIKKSSKTTPLLKQKTKQQCSLETKKRLYLDLPPSQSIPLSKSGKG